MSTIRNASSQIWHAIMYVGIGLGVAALTVWLSGKEPDFLDVAWHREVLIHSCAAAAVIYVLATIVQRNWFWAITAGTGIGSAVYMILEGVRPKGWIFWPFIDSAIQGTEVETILWLYGNCILLILISGAALVKIRL